ncbi:MAG: tol-pal system protein YbgF [Alphaproteobacteria bacterium]|nr:tol-pal system protein YbgF [Alphaproteobacteria bacterium]
MTAPYRLLASPLNQRWLKSALAVAVMAATPMLTAAPVVAQSGDVQPLVNTINRLERQLQALERTVYRGGSRPAGVSSSAPAPSGGNVPPAAASQLQYKTSQLEEQMRGLTGQIEEMGFKINQISDRLDRLVADVDFRLRTLEGSNAPGAAAPGTAAPAADSSIAPPVPTRSAPPYSTVARGAGAPPAPTTAQSLGTLTQRQIDAANIKPPSPQPAGTQQASANPGAAASLPAGSPEDRYNYARSFLMRRDFVGAEQALRSFVDTYPENPLSGNAQYWLGETYYVRNDFGAAARTFADGFQRYPDSSKAPDNLLKLSMSLAALERTDDACITLQKLASEYPQSPASIKQRAQTERTRLKCK